MNRIGLISLFALLAALVTLPAVGDASGDPYTQAVLDYDHGRFEVALPALRRLADRGHAGAEFILGAMYFYGKGVTRNDKLAAVWFHKSALKGNANAQLAFGSLHIRGLGVTQDLVAAFKWLSIAAGQNIPALQQQALSLRSEAGKLMQPDEIERGRRQAADFSPSRAGLTAP